MGEKENHMWCVFSCMHILSLIYMYTLHTYMYVYIHTYTHIQGYLGEVGAGDKQSRVSMSRVQGHTHMEMS